MQRNWDLLRKIMLHIEAQPESQCQLRADDWPEYGEDEVNYHLNLLIEARLVKGECSVRRSAIVQCRVTGLSWAGHEFLDSIRGESAWLNIKKEVKARGLELGFDVVKLAAGKLAESLF